MSGLTELRIRVYYEDTDAGGIVYHANYLNFMERARTEALLAAGLRQTDLRERYGLIFAVREILVTFLAPARLEDQLVVKTRSEVPRGARLEMAQEVWRDATLLVHARVTLACVGATGRPSRMPPELVDALTRLAAV